LIALIVALMITSMIASFVAADFHNDVLGKLKGNKPTYSPGSDTIPGNGKFVQFYNRHQSMVDFFIMFSVFCSIVLIGLKKVGYGDTGNAMKGLAIAFGAALALASLKAGISPSFFIPFVKNFLFLIVFFVIFLIIRSTVGEDKILGPLVAALIITWVAFNVFNLVIEPADKKFDLVNVFGMLTGAPTDTDETRRLNNKQLDNLQQEIDALNARKKVLEAALGRDYSSLFLAKRDLETETDKQRKEWLEELVAVMEELEKLENKRSLEVTSRLEIDKQVPSVPRVSLQIVDNDLVCRISSGGIINGNPAGINSMIEYRFEFYLEDSKVHEKKVLFADRDAGVMFSPEEEGIWSCRVYANMPSEGIFADSFGEASVENLGPQYAADKRLFDDNVNIIKTEREVRNINAAVSNLKGLKGRAFFNRNNAEIERFINSGEIKIKVVSKYIEAVAIEVGLPDDLAARAAQVAQMVTIAKEALELWKQYRDVDSRLYDDISKFITKHGGVASSATARPGELDSDGNLIKRELVVTYGTQRIDDGEVVSGVVKGEYLVAVKINPEEVEQKVVQGNKISFSIILDSQLRNKFNVVVEHDFDGTKKLSDDDIVEVADIPMTANLKYTAESHYDVPRTLNIKVYDVDYDSRDDNELIVDKTYRITTESSGVIDTSKLGVGDI
jgi:hypothetical protein